MLVIAAVVFAILLGFGLSQCARGCSAQDQQASSNASQAAQTDSAQATSASAQTADGDASPAASDASGQEPQVPTGPIAAQPGDVSYPVVQAAKLAYRDYDFRVDPSRTTWNFENSNGHKTIYLTFDDGPSENTQRALDILDQYGCKATFFVTGQNPDYFPMIKEAYKRGHTIGLHTNTHDYERCYQSVDSFWAEIDEIGQIVKDQIGYVPCFIRFPGGSSNTISADYSDGIMSQLVGEVQARGYQYYDWNLSCGDGSVHTTEETIMLGCEETDFENPTYLLHDGTNKETTIEALPSIIEYYQAQGFTFEALDRNSVVCHHGVSN